MNPLGDSISEYFRGYQTAASALNELNITIPPIRFSNIITEGITQAKTRKILDLLPITELEIDLRDCLDSVDDILIALTTGRWIRVLTIYNVRNTIKILPTSVEEIIIHAKANSKAILDIIGMEHVRSIKLYGGLVNTATFNNLARRSTRLQNLEFINTAIETERGLCRAIVRVANFKTTNVLFNGAPASTDEIHTD